MAMFDLEDCKNINLGGNKTSGGVLLRGRNLDGLSAIGNEAGLSKPKALWKSMLGVLCRLL
jgi:hypothetical protein